MKGTYVFYVLFFVMLIQTSCRSTKDITMFQELYDDSKIVYTAPPPPNIKINLFDNLYISVLTLDPEVNKILNPNVQQEGNSSGTAQNFGYPVSQYINGYRISSDSLITLPILGKINLVGLSLEEAHEHLKIRANEFLKEPQIQVKFLNYRVNVSGEIRNPGIYYNYEGNLNLLDAIGMANGITEFADLSNVIVKRQNERDFTSHKVNLTDNSVYSSEVFYLQPNDLIYIPPSDLKRRSANSDTYTKFLGTISTILVAAALILRL